MSTDETQILDGMFEGVDAAKALISMLAGLRDHAIECGFSDESADYIVLTILERVMGVNREEE